MPLHGRNGIRLAAPWTIRIRPWLERMVWKVWLVAMVTCPDEQKNLPDDSNLAAWSMHDVDMIQTAPVQVNSRSRYVPS
ncbi:hypothetical protein AJ78_06003 [Emergomyces pasteurianus Ep9510]|uniref:Uncharacterized protein n=1 Tax=Emergomyces pasteurianus Ep9510 TaxID=1447872 RepID=A0A1J9QBL9_9EURO|nr:hypothetical protein AJ78_06003 [Emergomyces pasteurianus Ep9510]